MTVPDAPRCAAAAAPALPAWLAARRWIPGGEPPALRISAATAIPSPTPRRGLVHLVVTTGSGGAEADFPVLLDVTRTPRDPSTTAPPPAEVDGWSIRPAVDDPAATAGLLNLIADGVDLGGLRGEAEPTVVLPPRSAGNGDLR
ncbi:hypothetical protein FHR81_003432 [Actinoalloteichus hoggarensis]|uniref:Uncharacterized protein n=1 Tax=Actinoalloteichus hoggarensis TaxID=1470176 RepID=A0A221W7V2_9PSEU|nr:hypothetical protein [Actinoalloteichus hoggarensis]ASO21783.1 hypothetical protein AHOG_20830 [Actinoalloteichus hoggarensis]MBB5922380.1 hypothetical protein [Actinoalloteichus hoggarensis]